MYDQFDTIAAAKYSYRRCRTMKHFILTDKGVKRYKRVVCAACGENINDPPKKYPDFTTGHSHSGNRCQYYPKTKKVAVMHYVCAWDNLLNHIFLKERLI